MKATSKIHAIAAWALLLFVFVISGCNNPAKQEQQESATTDSIPQEITLSPETQSLLYSFPTPFEVTNLLEKAKAGFIFDMTNPPSNLQKYNTETSQALNLGIYSADLCYSATYRRTEETGKFLECTSKLADGLGIAGVYDQTLIDKVKQFGNNKDSLVALFQKVFGKTNDFLSQNNRTRIAVLIACGGFSEALYLAGSLAEVAKDNTKIMTIIAGQKDNYAGLMRILEAYKEDANMKPVYDEMARLQPIWTNYGIDTGKKIEQQKVVEVSDLAESVRLVLTK